MEQVDTAESRDELNQKEMAWIERENSIHPNGYNVDKGCPIYTFPFLMLVIL